MRKHCQSSTATDTAAGSDAADGSRWERTQFDSANLASGILDNAESAPRR